MSAKLDSEQTSYYMFKSKKKKKTRKPKVNNLDDYMLRHNIIVKAFT